VSRLLAALFALMLAAPAAAHTTATGLAVVEAGGDEIAYRLTLVPAELPGEPAALLARAADGDGASAQAVADLLRRHLGVAVDGAPCRPGRIRLQGGLAGERVDAAIAWSCPNAPGRLELRDDLSEAFGSHYRTLASVRGAAGGGRDLVLDADDRHAAVELGRPADVDWRGFVALGVEHILTGLDHLLFLAALLIGAPSLLGTLAIVTAFTLAHSLTLTLASLDLVRLPAGIVEPAIAASIVWVALENLLPRRASGRRWAVAFLFGLMHGFGFAAVLSGLELSGWRLGAALLSFNLGVELGQAAVVAVVLPALLWLRARPEEPRLARVASLALAGIGAFWFVERVAGGI
jgi:hydrogenase/urease accessory protein HupE